MALNKYEVLEGKHREPTGPRKFKEYSKGETFTSDRDLCKAFPCKFRHLGPAKAPKAAKPAKPAKPAPAEKLDKAPDPPAETEEETENEAVAVGTDGDGWDNEKD